MAGPAGVDLKGLLEQLDRLIDKPHDHNALLAKLYHDIYNQILANTVFWRDGILFSADPVRQKSISTHRQTITSGYYGNRVTNRYLRMSGVTMAGDAGFLVPRSAVITGLWAKSRSHGSWSIEVRRNGVPITLVNVPIVGSFGADTDLDIEVEAGDWLQFYLNGTDVEHPIAHLELAWRI